MRRKLARFTLALFGTASALALTVGFAQTTGPTVQTDLPDYAPGATAQITGYGFGARETVTLQVTHLDGVTEPGEGHAPWAAATDAQGHFETTWYVDPDDSVGATFLLTAVGQSSGLRAQTTFTDAAAANIDQCRNGAAAAPNNCLDLGGSDGWVNGNAGNTQAHYVEGYSIPYRAVLTDLPPNTQITIDLGYDVKNSGSGGTGRNAIDFLTHFARLESHAGFGHPAESVDPVSGVDFVPGNGAERDIDPPPGPPTTRAIPVPASTSAVPDPVGPAQLQPATRFNSLPLNERVMTLWGGTIDNIAYVTQGDLTADNSETVVRVTLTTGTSPVAVLAWGGHIARCADWGRTGTVCNSATGISGSPYHMRLKAWSLGNLGNQDRSLSAAAVFPTGTVIITKQIIDDGRNNTFSFNDVGLTTTGTFSLTTVDPTKSQTRTFTEVLAGRPTSVTELTPPTGWEFVNVICVDPDNGTTMSGRTATIDLDANETVHCTFRNREDFTQTRGKIIVRKVTEPSSDTTTIFDFTKDYGADAFTLRNGESNDSGFLLEPGTYSVAELTPPSGWTLASATCDDGSAPSSIGLAAGETVTCTFTNRQNGTIVVDKVTIPSGDSQSFSFTTTGTGYAPFSLTDAQAPNSQSVAPGAYAVTETPLAGWDLTSGVCDQGETPESLDVGPGETVTCTFTNTKRATIIIDKVTVPSGETQLFTFTPSYNSGATFQLADATAASNSGQLALGSYTVVESTQAGWALTNIACTDPTSNSSGNTGTRTATIDLAAGETVTCRFTNTKPDARITLTPGTATNPINEPHVITALVQQNTGSGFVAAPDGTQVTLSLLNNTASATFVGGVNTCTTTGGSGQCMVTINASQAGNVDIRGATTLSVLGVSLTRTTGDGVSGDSSDAKKTYVSGTIIIDKVTVPGGETQLFTFTPSYNNGATFQLADATAANNSGQLAPGSYMVVELTQAGWALTNIACTDPTSNSSGNTGTRTATIDLAAGETVTCTFTNTKPDARITLTPGKATNPINERHVITALVQQNIGSGFVAAPDATLVTFSLLNNTAGASFVGSVNTCTTTAGTCTTTINASQAGSVDIRGTTTLSVLGVSLTRTTGDGISGDSPDANKQYVSGRIIVDKVTVPSGEVQLFTFTPSYNGGEMFQLADATTPNDSGQLAPGTYSVSEAVPTGWDLMSATCSDGSPVTAINLSAGETVTCTFYNRKRGRVVIEKQTNPDGATGNFSFTGAVVGSIGDGGQIVVSNVTPGEYPSTETNPAPNFDLALIQCSDGNSTGDLATRTVTFRVEAGEEVKCTFTNSQRGMAKVIKTVLGAPPSGAQAFTFQLRQNASPTQNGTTLEALIANATNGGELNFTTKLVSGQNYQLCEVVMPGWSTTLGTFVPSSFMPPDGVVANPNVDNSILCIDFSVAPGETKSFAIDNTPPPGGRALTIGFWKNWSSCSGGNQKPVLDQTLASSIIIGDMTDGHSTLPGIVVSADTGMFAGFGPDYSLVLHGSPASPNAAPDCQKAVRILDKSRIDNGRKSASNPAFNLAAQLLAAELNYVAGAGRTPTATSAINEAVKLLGGVNFNGVSHSPIPQAVATRMNELATILDSYNNNRP